MGDAITPAVKIDTQALRLEDKCRLLGGASTWRTHAIEHAGIPAIKMSDGPNGIRGDGLGAHGTPGVVVPVGIALGATWDPDLVGQVGELLGREARRKAAHVLLGPTINLQRTPIGGRVFECFSEDPELTARVAVAYVRGVQSEDVAVAVKHFVANDTELDRFTVDVHIEDRPLRELYLRPFEAVVTEARPWALMTAYNQLRGTHCSEHEWLLRDVLRGEWGFDGLVISDWFGFHETVASARAGLAMPMPGPNTIYGDQLVEAVRAEVVDEGQVEELVAEVVRLIERTHADERSSEAEEQAVDDPDERALCRRAVAAGAILLRNRDATLPLVAGSRVAVLGQNAADTRIMGGGSASLEPLPHRSILEALRARPELDVAHEVGVRIDKMAPPATADRLRTPDDRPGLLVQYRDGSDPEGPILVEEVATSTSLRWFGSTPKGVDPNTFNVTIVGEYVPDATGTFQLSAVTTGPSRVVVGGTTVLDDPNGSGPRGEFFFGLGSVEHLAMVDLEQGVPVPVRMWMAGAGGFAGVRVGLRPPEDPDRMDRAVQLASEAGTAVVVVGTNEEWETEGEDRSSIALPGMQDELIRRVAEVSDRTIVVVNTGSPVAMPWRDDVDAILVAHFGGTAMGEGIVDVLLGDSDPGGRLPMTWPARLEDVPAWEHHRPVDNVQTYGEGLAMGYRGMQVEPLYAFGHGLSYGEVEWVGLRVPEEVVTGEDVQVLVTVKCTSQRQATVVAQAYLGPVVAGDPPLRLAGFAKAVVAPGMEQDLLLTIPADGLRSWDRAASTWVVAKVVRSLAVGPSSSDLRLRGSFHVTPAPAPEPAAFRGASSDGPGMILEG